MRPTIAAILALTLLTGIALAVAFGVPDAGKHPYVGTLFFQVGADWYSCSGTLISPTVVLTAGHCTAEGGVTVSNMYVSFADKISFPGLKSWDDLEAYLNSPKHGWVKAKQVIPHPLYNDFAQFPRTYDVGIVILSKEQKMSAYGTLPPEGFLNLVAANTAGITNRFTLVGYGMQGAIPAFYSDIWERYRGTVRLIELNSANTGGQSAKFTANPGQGGASCYGDSGGPIFYGDSNMITNVVSWSITPCIGNSYEFRIDTPVALDFIRQYVP